MSPPKSPPYMPRHVRAPRPALPRFLRPGQQAAVPAATTPATPGTPSTSAALRGTVGGRVVKRAARKSNLSRELKLLMPAAKRFLEKGGDNDPDDEPACVVQPFRFLDLPSEIRNMVYEMTTLDSKQALVRHLPRRQSLRNPPRNTHRPFVGLTQVCRQIRFEYLHIYMLKQEIGFDITDTTKYMNTFYLNAFILGMPGAQAARVGNMTLAIGDNIRAAERGGIGSAGGTDVWPLLNVWANSQRVEAGFGRYVRNHYNPSVDGEAKDLYRLFGRRVLEDRSVGPMNRAWRAVLRGRQLRAVNIHREPDDSVRPYIHILFQIQYSDLWMRAQIANPPAAWLAQFGFDGMEYFRVRVGAF